MKRLEINQEMLNRISREYRAEDSRKYNVAELERIRWINESVSGEMKTASQDFAIQSTLQGEDEINYFIYRN